MSACSELQQAAARWEFAPYHLSMAPLGDTNLPCKFIIPLPPINKHLPPYCCRTLIFITAYADAYEAFKPDVQCRHVDCEFLPLCKFSSNVEVSGVAFFKILCYEHICNCYIQHPHPHQLKIQPINRSRAGSHIYLMSVVTNRTLELMSNFT